MDNTGHTEWVDGRCHQTGFTATFAPNTEVGCTLGGPAYDIDWTNMREGQSATVPTYATVTARSHHSGLVHVTFMDGSARSVADGVALEIWQALSTRSGNEIATVSD
jgi:hypothetical protein